MARVPVLSIHTPEGLVLEREIAGAGSRAAAGLCDLFLIGMLYAIALLGASLVLAIDLTGVSGILQGVLLAGLPLLLAGYHFVFHAFGGGRTPGKRFLGLCVIGADGYPATLTQHLLRSALWMLDVVVLVPLPLGLFVIALSARRQRIGDVVAGTLVVREDEPVGREEPFPGESWSRLEQRTLDLHPGSRARLGEEDYELLRELWTRSLPDAERRRLFVETARELSGRLGLGPVDDARVALKELYLFLREFRGTRRRPARRPAAQSGLGRRSGPG
jgi:uncharacterized RDD family membrane protein YckC